MAILASENFFFTSYCCCSFLPANLASATAILVATSISSFNSFLSPNCSLKASFNLSFATFASSVPLIDFNKASPYCTNKEVTKDTASNIPAGPINELAIALKALLAPPDALLKYPKLPTNCCMLFATPLIPYGAS